MAGVYGNLSRDDERYIDCTIIVLPVNISNPRGIRHSDIESQNVLVLFCIHEVLAIVHLLLLQVKSLCATISVVRVARFLFQSVAQSPYGL